MAQEDIAADYGVTRKTIANRLHKILFKVEIAAERRAKEMKRVE